MAGWHQLSAMAVRPDRSLGCHGCNHVGRFLPHSFFCCCSCSFQEGRQIPWSPSL